MGRVRKPGAVRRRYIKPLLRAARHLSDAQRKIYDLLHRDFSFFAESVYELLPSSDGVTDSGTPGSASLNNDTGCV